MDKFFSVTKLAHSSHEDSTYGRFGGPSSAFMSWPTVKPFYDPSSYLSLKNPDFKVEKDEKMGKTYSFKDIMDSGPPMTSVFMGLMQRRKRRENRPRRQRTTFTSEQTLKLELEYNRTEYISRPRRYEIAKLLNLSENQIKIWFQNRRAKEKRIEKAHIDQQIRNSSVTSVTDTSTASHSGYPICNPYVWPYTPATLTAARLLPDTDANT